MKRACLLLLPAMLLIALAAPGCTDDHSKPIFTRVRVTPACGVAPMDTEVFAAVSGGNESGDPMGGTNNLEIAWNFGDGATSSTAISYNQYMEPGEYTITVTATDPDGETATSKVPVTVLADSLVIAVDSNFPDGNVTVGERIQFDLAAFSCDINFPTVPGDSVKMVYLWDMGAPGDSLFTGSMPSFTYAAAGTYDVNLAVTYPALAVTRRATLQFVVGP
jgi:PKD repeat protein